MPMTDLLQATAPTEAPKTAIELIGVNKWYGAFHVLRDINLTVARGERIVMPGRRARASRR